jgi:hypothetical protein
LQTDSVKIPADWLTERVEDAPTHYDPGHAADALRIRMAWQKLKSEAAEGDELWAWATPPASWKKQGKLAGYALVRDGLVGTSVRTTSR